jgi:hypothetical protein
LDIRGDPPIKRRELPTRRITVDQERNRQSQPGYLPVSLEMRREKLSSTSASRTTYCGVKNDTFRADVRMYELCRVVKEGQALAKLEDTLLNLVRHEYDDGHAGDTLVAIHTSTSSSSTRDACFPDPGIECSRDDRTGSVANTISVLVSSRGSTISVCGCMAAVSPR